MKSSIRRDLLVAGSVLCLAVGGAVLAQPAPPPNGQGPAPAEGRPDWRDPAQREAMRARHAEMRAQRLNEILQLRPEQQGALHAFLDSMRPPGDRGGRMHDHDQDRDGQAETLSTPERLDRQLARFDEMRARLVSRAAATKTFYAQLSPQQQTAFDALGAHMGGGHRFGGFGGMGHHGPGGPGFGRFGPPGPDAGSDEGPPG